MPLPVRDHVIEAALQSCLCVLPIAEIDNEKLCRLIEGDADFRQRIQIENGAFLLWVS